MYVYIHNDVCTICMISVYLFFRQWAGREGPSEDTESILRPAPPVSEVHK